MDDEILKGNLIAISQRESELNSRLSMGDRGDRGDRTEGDIAVSRYRFQESRSGETVPAWVDSAGTAHPLHSMVDPKREAKRLIDTVESQAFLILLGLGGAYQAEAALNREDVSLVLVVEFGLDGFKELIRRLDFTRLFMDPRFHLFVDLPDRELQRQIISLYQPALYGALRVIPLRPRTSLEPEPFAAITKTIESALSQVSQDFSVQAHFGRRWFSNIVRNLKSAETDHGSIPPISRAAVCAAGPSLSLQIPALREKLLEGKEKTKAENELFLIATDTSLPCLLSGGIKPDAVISIDCQHYSYYHFMDALPEETFLFLDLASPPLLASRSKRLKFFTGGHPLTRYISQTWKSLPELDTSGGNVCHAAVSLAEQLGALEIELYGADFSYPLGATYAKGAYIYPLFERRQNRLSPLEAQASAFLYRTPLEMKTGLQSQAGGAPWRYETRILSLYRERLGKKIKSMEASLKLGGKGQKAFTTGEAIMDSGEFLQRYKIEISRLPKPGKSAGTYLANLEGKARSVFTTILPLMAALKRRRPQCGFGDLIEETKSFCVKEIDAVINSQ